MRDHRKLKAFQLADELILDIYSATSRFPSHELFGLTSQMRRAAVSAAVNMVEGCARGSEKQFCHFLSISFGSMRELDYLIELSQRLGYLPENSRDDLTLKTSRTCRVLSSLLWKVRQSVD